MDYPCCKRRWLARATYGSCALECAQIPDILTLVAINVTILCISSYEAYKARHLSTEYVESQYSFRVLVSIVLVCFVGGPVLLLANARISLWGLPYYISVTSSGTLLWIFIPKIRLPVFRDA